MFPLGQFIGSPFTGFLSDAFGRRVILLISLCLAVPAFFLSGYAIWSRRIYLLYFSRLLAGVFESNVVVAQAAIADISESQEEKTKTFGWIMSFTAMGFILGPMIGGFLIYVPLFSAPGMSTPFWFAGFLALLTFLLTLWIFQETKLIPSEKLRPKEVLVEIFFPFKHSFLRGIYIGNYFIFQSTFFFFSFLPVMLVRKFDFSAAMIGITDSYLSLIVTLAPVTYGFLARRFSSGIITIYTGVGLACSLIFFILLEHPSFLIFTLIPVGYFTALALSYTNIYVSDCASERRQGSVLGLNKSVEVLADAMSGLVGGILAGFVVNLPFYVAIALALISALWLYLVQRRDFEKLL
ncbi:MAG: Enterobactin exporter EntS [Chlamydiia bacterium]|nr:Enterobactin exporter EntS [Chlamydiia bacterium]